MQFFSHTLFHFRYHEEKKGGKKGDGKKGHHEKEEKGKSLLFCRKYSLKLILCFYSSGWHSKKEESGEHAEKSEKGKKGGDKKFKKWGHKKG